MFINIGYNYLMSVFEIFIFIKVNPKHITYFHNILETLLWVFLNDS